MPKLQFVLKRHPFVDFTYIDPGRYNPSMVRKHDYKPFLNYLQIYIKWRTPQQGKIRSVHF